MTEAQWLFEYHALRKKEEGEQLVQVEVLKTAAKVLRNTLIGVLGLDLFPPPDVDEAAAADSDVPLFTPASLLMSNHHLLRVAIDEAAKRTSDKEAAVAAANDAAFEEFSKRLARGDVGDMDPILLGAPVSNSYWNSEETQQMLAILGVKPRPADASVVPHFGKKKPATEEPVVAFTPGKITILDDDEEYKPGIELELGVRGGEG